MTKKTKKRNPADLTKRNNDAIKKRLNRFSEWLAELEIRILSLEHIVKLKGEREERL